MKQAFFIFVTVLSLSSCGVFLQKTGVKNYSIKEKISKKGLNNYQYDFLYLTKLVEQGFPQIDSIFPKENRQLQAKKIVSNLTQATNHNDFIIQSRKYLSNLKNQHTSISLGQEFKKVYPFVIYNSYDNWYLLNLPKQYDSLHIGKRIVNINGLSASEVEKRLIDFTFAENKINQQHQILNLQLYNKPQYLKEIGIIKDVFEDLRISFEDSSEIIISSISAQENIHFFDISFKENPLTKYQNETYHYQLYSDRNFGYLQFNKCHDKIDILESIGSYVKPWLQPVVKGYVKRQFKKKKPSKQIVNFYNPKYPVFKDFIWELIDSLRVKKIENLVIDLRNNPGGNLTLGIQLMYFLTDKNTLENFKEYGYTSDIYKSYFPKEYKQLEKNYLNGVPQNSLVLENPNNFLFQDIIDSSSKYFIPKNRPVFNGNIYILSNYRTGSAAAMLTTLFQDNGIGTIIGTSVGNNPIGATTYTPMLLPKTKAKISVASTYIERPKKTNGKIQIPDIWVEYSINDLINGNDPYLEKTQTIIRQKGKN